MDGIRGVACLVVLIGHAVMYSFDRALWMQGYTRIGVMIFFVLSAFLLTRNLLTSGIHPRSLLDYTLNRSARVLPLFWLCVAAMVWTGELDAGDMVRVVTFREYVNHLWTVPVEMTFYLCLPFVLFATTLVQRRYGWPMAICAILALIMALSIAWPPLDVRLLHEPFWYGSVFLFGVIAACSVAAWPTPTRRQVTAVALAGIGTVAATIVMNKAGLLGNGAFCLFDMNFRFGIGFALIVYAVHMKQPQLERALAFAPLVLVGKASYSIYIWHMTFVAWFMSLPFPASTIATVVSSIAFGYLSYIAIEMPIFRARKMIFRPARRADAIA